MLLRKGSTTAWIDAWNHRLTLCLDCFSQLRSKPPVSPPEERLPESSSPPRLPVSLPPPPEELRSPTDTDPELSPFARSVVTKSRPTFLSASCLSSVLSVRSPKTSSLIFDSKDLPSWPSKKPPRPTSLVFSRIPTCVLSTPSV
jgi:hypothetical protein